MKVIGHRNLGLLPVDCTITAVEPRAKFLPNIISRINQEVCKRHAPQYDPDIVYREESIIRSTLAACCLVSHDWNKVSTPFLYGDTTLRGKKSSLSQSLLHRTLRHTNPYYRTLVKSIAIEAAEDGSTSNLLSICFAMPNLRRVTLEPQGLDPTKLHPNFVQHVQSLSKRCTVQMGAGYEDIQWDSLYHWLKFLRHSQCCFRIRHSRDVILFTETYFYTGDHEISVDGDVRSPDIKYFQQHLKRTSNRLRGLKLFLWDSAPFPEIDLGSNHQLRLLIFDLNLKKEEIKNSIEDVTRWFTSTCKTVTSQSIAIALESLPEEIESCMKIEDTILDLNGRIEDLTVYLCGNEVNPNEAMSAKEVKTRFSKLYEAGIVVEKVVWDNQAAMDISFGR